jgi:bifunctional DNase/RNase
MLVKVEFASFAVDPVSNVPFIILKEIGGQRTMPVRIGPLEAGAIAVETLRVSPLSPLTIDVAQSLMKKLGGTLERAVIGLSPSQGLVARLDITKNGAVHSIDCTPSDAIALALRCRAPLFAREAVFEKFSPKNGLSEGEELRARIAALDTLEFGTAYLE